MFGRNKALSLTVILLSVVAVAAVQQNPPSSLGPRPEDFEYPPFDYTFPEPSEFRHTLSNGLIVYVAEDHEIPWFNATLMVRTGPFLEPRNKIGLDSLTTKVMRTGGSTSMTGEEITERMDFLGGRLGFPASAKGLSIHVRHVDEGLRIWLDVLTNPAFPEDKLEREKETAIPSIRNRNRNVGMVADRVFRQLVYGNDSPITAETTEAGIRSITREDLVAWHKKYWGAENAILVVSGDFKKEEMLRRLESSFGKWGRTEKAVSHLPSIPKPEAAGVYLVQPEGSSPNQGTIRMGHLGLKVDDPDFPAVDLMNWILGGGSFSSRIMKVVRTDNGLAYSVGSSFSGGSLYPGTFTISCQTKNSTVVFATQLILDQIERMRNGEVEASDLRLAKNARVNAFPTQLVFSSLGSIAEGYAGLEFDGRPVDHYATYLERYEKVTLADIERVARKYLRPSDMSIVIVGNIEECRKGAGTDLPNQALIDQMAAKYGGRSLEGLARQFGDGKVHIVPLE